MIGTAHISERSAELVRDTIKKVKPNVVMVELDVKRVDSKGVVRGTEGTLGYEAAGFVLPSESRRAIELQIKMQAEAASRRGIFSLGNIVQGWAAGIGGQIVGSALKSFYKSIENMGFTPGGEFKAAVEEGRKVGAKILLGDRDVDVTLNRLSQALASTPTAAFDKVSNRIQEFEQAVGMNLEPETLQNKAALSEYVEEMKRSDTMTNLMGIVKEELPLVYAVMINERDVYMANAIDEALSNLTDSVSENKSGGTR